MGPLDLHLDVLQQSYPNASIKQRQDGSAIVRIPNVPLDGERWNKKATTVYFVAPIGYPAAKPDSFWTDADLRLRNGNLPRNSGNQPLQGIGVPTLWFSWHASSWNVNKDDLRTYLRVIEDRLKRSE